MPNPCVREYNKSERLTYIHGPDTEKTTQGISDILFKGQNNDLFMIFNTSEVSVVNLKPDDKAWKLGVLNLNPEDKQSLPFPGHHYEAQNAFESLKDISKDAVGHIQVE